MAGISVSVCFISVIAAISRLTFTLRFDIKKIHAISESIHFFEAAPDLNFKVQKQSQLGK
jgi:hypothetical protein